MLAFVLPFKLQCVLAEVDLHSQSLDTPLLLGSIFFIFMQFSGKFDQINRDAPFGISTPPLENPGLATVKILENVMKNNLFNEILARLNAQSICPGKLKQLSIDCLPTILSSTAYLSSVLLCVIRHGKRRIVLLKDERKKKQRQDKTNELCVNR